MRPLLWFRNATRPATRLFCYLRAPDCCLFVGRRRIQSRDALAVRWGIRMRWVIMNANPLSREDPRECPRPRPRRHSLPTRSSKRKVIPWPCSLPTPFPIRRSSCPPSGAARRRPSPTPSPPTARSPDAWPPTDPTLSSSPRLTRRCTVTGSSSPTRRRKLARWPPSGSRTSA